MRNIIEVFPLRLHHNLIFQFSIGLSLNRITLSSYRRLCTMFSVYIFIGQLGTFSRLWGLEVELVLTITVPDGTWGTCTVLYGDLLVHTQKDIQKRANENQRFVTFQQHITLMFSLLSFYGVSINIQSGFVFVVYRNFSFMRRPVFWCLV